MNIQKRVKFDADWGPACNIFSSTFSIVTFSVALQVKMKPDMTHSPSVKFYNEYEMMTCQETPFRGSY